VTEPGGHVPGKGVGPAQPTTPANFEVFTQFIAVQTKQNEIREKEVEIQKFNAETERTKVINAHDFSLKSLDAQVNDRKDVRQTESGATQLGFWIILIIVLGLFGIIGYSLYANKEQFIVEIIKLLAVGGGGGGIGYAIGVRKSGSPNQPTS
jgi:hypothetical protein